MNLLPDCQKCSRLPGSVKQKLLIGSRDVLLSQDTCIVVSLSRIHVVQGNGSCSVPMQKPVSIAHTVPLAGFDSHLNVGAVVVVSSAFLCLSWLNVLH